MITQGKIAAEKASALQNAVSRQIPHAETILHQQDDGKEHIAVTDRRLVITKVGKWLGERSESIPLGAISGLSTHVDEGRVILLQIAVPGRSMGEIALTGEDLSQVMAALVTALPRYGGTA